MNKTIHELTQLTEVAESDELIVYDVSEATSKKVTKQNLLKKQTRFPDYLHPLLNGALPSDDGYTATQDCYVNIFYIILTTTHPIIDIEIDGVNVISSDSSTVSGVRATIIHFSGFIKSGQTIKMKRDNAYIAPNAGFYVFPLM